MPPSLQTCAYRLCLNLLLPVRQNHRFCSVYCRQQAASFHRRYRECKECRDVAPYWQYTGAYCPTCKPLRQARLAAARALRPSLPPISCAWLFCQVSFVPITKTQKYCCTKHGAYANAYSGASAEASARYSVACAGGCGGWITPGDYQTCYRCWQGRRYGRINPYAAASVSALSLLPLPLPSAGVPAPVRPWLLPVLGLATGLLLPVAHRFRTSSSIFSCIPMSTVIRQTLLAGATFAVGYWLGRSARPIAVAPTLPAPCSLELDLGELPVLATELPNHSISISDLKHHLDLAAGGGLDEQDLVRLIPGLSNTDLLTDLFSSGGSSSLAARPR